MYKFLFMNEENGFLLNGCSLTLYISMVIPCHISQQHVKKWKWNFAKDSNFI